jgi:hypothetical protein
MVLLHFLGNFHLGEGKFLSETLAKNFTMYIEKGTKMENRKRQRNVREEISR